MADRYRNDYNDQDYPRYYDRNDRYDSQSERGGESSGRGEREQRNRFGSGRENTQGGSYDYNQSNKRSGSSGMSGGQTANSDPRSNDDFASTARKGGGYGNNSQRGMRDDRGDYTLYGYDRDQRPVDRSGDYGGRQSGRSGDYGSNYNFSGGSYARSDDDQRPSDGRGGSSRYRGEQGNQDFYGHQQTSGQSFYGQGGDYTGGSQQGYGHNRREKYNDNRSSRPSSEQEERGWWERTTDEVASWFGDGEATHRRERDSRESDYSQYQNRGQYGQQDPLHRGRGPKNYRRSDERIKEDINDRLTDYAYLDASDIDVEVSGGEVILTGTVESRYAKRMAEDIAENASGVTHVENRLRVKNQNRPNESSNQNQAGFSSSSTAGSASASSSGTYGSREDLAANYTNQGLTEASSIGKEPTGDLTGSNQSAADSNELSKTAAAGESDSSSSTAFSQRGVDKLSDSTK